VIDAIGWVATALFVLSYAAKDRRHLLALQVVAALVWIGYGTLLRAVPVIVANCLVAAAAAFSGLRSIGPSEEG
jgi:hypothetical protein